jgi:hypothetical protein
VDSIYFQGLDKEAFSVVSGLPKYKLESGFSNNIEILFKPVRFGKNSAEIVVITQADTIIRNIVGEGLESFILIENPIIDFGKVPLGFHKDTIQVLTIKNLSNKVLHITNTKHNKPNDYDFKNGNIGAFDLKPNEIKRMDLRFEPSAVGRTSGTLEFYYDSEGSPTVIQLYGEGVKLNPQELTAPLDDTINIPIDCKLKWKENTTKTSFTLQLAKDLNFTDIVIDTTINQTNFVCSKLDFLQQYFWRVKPGKIADISDWSNTWRFTTLMDSVNLTSPTDLSRNQKKDIELLWEKGVYNKSYRLQVSLRNDFFGIADNDPSCLISKSNQVQENLQYFTKYFWRVRNESGDTLGYWSKVWQFNTGMSNIGLIYPANNDIGLENEINFKWNSVIGAEYYQLQISKNNQFTNLVFSKDSIKTTEIFVPDLEPEVNYFWRVRVWNEESIGTAFWSDVWTFTTGTSSVIEESEGIRIIPNPAGDYITVTLGAFNPKVNLGVDIPSEIQIYNTLGEKVTTPSLLGNATPPTEGNFRINISTLPKGMYFVRIGGEIAKFMKM